MPRYSYYDYLENWYDDYYKYSYWPQYYDNLYNTTNSTYTINGTFPPSPYQQPFQADFICPLIFYLSVICTILSICILSLAIYKIYEQKRKNKLTANRIIIVLSLLCLAMHTITNIFNMLTLYTWYIDFRIIGKLRNMAILWDIFWCLSKYSLYIVFMQRYYSIFTALNATMGLRLRKFIIFAIACIIQTTLIIMYILIYYHKLDVAKSYEHHRRAYLNLFWSFLVGDIVLISLLGYLLTRSIFKLIVAIDARRSVFEVELPASEALSLQISNTGTVTSSTNDISTTDRSTAVSVTQDSELNLETLRVASITKKVLRKRTTKQEQLIFTTTRLVLLYVISLTSSVIYQFIWALSEELFVAGLSLFTYSWYIDATINMVCIYLSIWVARPHYKLICQDLCQCHQCTLLCIHKLIAYKAAKEREQFRQFTNIQEEELEEDRITVLK